MLVLRDITRELNQQEALRRSEERFRLLAENAADIVFRVRLVPERRFEYMSPAVTAIVGYAPEEHYADPDLGFRLVHPDDRGAWLAMDNDDYHFDRPVTLRWLHRDGRVVWAEHRITPVRTPDGSLVALEGIARDVTERKEMEAQLLRLSSYDPLTGVYNRAHFTAALTRMERAGVYPITVVSTDVDGLKLVNDTMSHGQGDRLLQAFATILKDVFTDPHVVARMGGDEFVVALPNTDLRTAAQLCHRVEQAIAAHSQRQPGLPLQVSMGLSSAERPSDSLTEVVSRADRSMYRVKLQRTTTSAHRLVTALTSTRAAKYNESEGHLAQVAALARRLEEAIGLSPGDLADLVLLAEMHDVGKAGVPERVLFKEGPLSADEHQEMQQHTLIGFRIARSSPELAHIARMVLHHHEWWDGQGYPAGLRGVDIPLASRLVAIADAYDAITTGRQGRPARSHAEALAEIAGRAGTQFDPALVAAFMGLWQTGVP